MNFCGQVLWKRSVIGACAFVIIGNPPSAAPAPAAPRNWRREGEAAAEVVETDADLPRRMRAIVISLGCWVTALAGCPRDENGAADRHSPLPEACPNIDHWETLCQPEFGRKFIST
jgi:hypothetical protein